MIKEANKVLEKKILNIGGSQLVAQKPKVGGLKLHINTAKEDITKAEVAMTEAEKNSIKFEGLDCQQPAKLGRYRNRT
jgi:structural maintenance of chromosome 4